MLYRNLILATILPCLWGICICLASANAESPDFTCFDTKDVNEPQDSIQVISPWKTIDLDPEYGGQWVVAGDIDNDGDVEIVSSENFNKGDVHYTSTAVAQDLDGSILWRWGNPNVGRKIWHHDVACQIHDWNGDNRNEVILCTKGFIVELDGTTGKEIRRIAIPEDATDCLVFCNISGNSYPSDVLVKDRYHRIWAYNIKGDLLWTITDPGGYRTAHQPRPIDIDRDGRDEIMAGYALLNSDGSVRWVFKSGAVDQSRGHLDCARILRHGDTPEKIRIALTCCGANNIALIDGNGKAIWELTSHHFESIDIGHIIPDCPGPQILVDIDHQPEGISPLWVISEQGELLGRLVTNYSRHHCLLDWDGDGPDEILVADGKGIYDYRGKRIATLDTTGLDTAGDKTKYEKSILTGDMTRDGVPDVLIATPNTVYVYRNTQGKKKDKDATIGTEFNFTLY